MAHGRSSTSFPFWPLLDRSLCLGQPVCLRCCIVDVGSQELAAEEDIHAPLRRAAPTEVIGFDPFAKGEVGEPVNISRPDGAVIRTYPNIVADGKPVTLHINRYDPTSSIFPSNLKLAGQFGLLAAALETVETREFLSVRLDDVLPDIAVDFLKIDVQGAAQLVLANAPRDLGEDPRLPCRSRVRARL